MKRLTVVYDASCGFCVRCRRWLERQRALVPLAFVAKGSAEAQCVLPTLRDGDDELVAVSDEGGVYRGERAFVMCLYALEAYRGWALRLGRPALLPLARQAFDVLSHHRKGLSRLLRLGADDAVAQTLQRIAPARCSLPAVRREPIAAGASPPSPPTAARSATPTRPSAG